jgi:hypothetical protein
MSCMKKHKIIVKQKNYTVCKHKFRKAYVSIFYILVTSQLSGSFLELHPLS